MSFVDGHELCMRGLMSIEADVAQRYITLEQKPIYTFLSLVSSECKFVIAIVQVDTLKTHNGSAKGIRLRWRSRHRQRSW